MFVSKIVSRIPKNSFNQCRFLVTARPAIPSTFPKSFCSIGDSSRKVTSFHHSAAWTTCSRGFWFSSSASPEPSEKENQRAEGQETVEDSKDNSTKVETVEANGEAAGKIETTGSCSETKHSPPISSRRRGGTKRTAFSDSDSEDELSMDDLVKLVAEKEESLKVKHKEIENMQDKVLRSYADMENVMERSRREAENSKKFAIQNFAKSLLDVADNLGRASAVVKDSFSKIDQSKDTAGAVPLLKTLLEGVEMTDKQLAEVFRKFGVEKFDPMNEHFDPNRHHALFQIADSSKPAGTVAAVLKAGYVLHDRIIRPAEVGVTEGGPEIEAAEKSEA